MKRTVDSVREIGGNQVKHIIIAPKKVIPTLQKEYIDIECISEPEGCKGIYPALNYAFNQYGHDYEYLTFINDDDYWLPDYRRLIDTLLNNSNIDLIYGRVQYINESHTIIGTQTSSYQFNSIISLTKSGIIPITQQAALIRAWVYFKVGGFDESYQLIADTKFWMEVSTLKLKYKYINKECAAYMYAKGQLTSQKNISKKEHTRLSTEFSAHYLNIKWQAFIFRVINLPIYIKRYIISKRIKSPFNQSYTS